MKIRSIEMDDAGEGPAFITATMTSDEAILIAKVFGRLTGTEKEEILFDGGATAGTSVYDALTSVFNAFFDEGVDGAMEVRP